MVTAPNKSSADATLEDYTEDGTSLAFTTVAGNIDQSGQGRAGFPGNLYVTNREDAGWQTIKNLNGPTGSLYTGPESLQFSGSSPSIYSADLQTSLWYTYPAPPGPDRAPDRTCATKKENSSRSGGPPGSPVGAASSASATASTGATRMI